MRLLCACAVVLVLLAASSNGAEDDGPICANVETVFNVATSMEGMKCIADHFLPLLNAMSNVTTNCGAFWGGVECLATVMATGNAAIDAQQCMKEFRKILYEHKDNTMGTISSLLASAGIAIGDPKFDPTICKEFWELPCPHGGGDKMDDASCTSECTMNGGECNAANMPLCCPVNDCKMACAPNMTLCTDVGHIARTVLSYNYPTCNSQFIGSIGHTDLDDYCRDMWGGFECISKVLVPEAYAKQCLMRIAYYVRLEPSRIMEELQKHIGDKIQLGIDPKMIAKTGECKENPLTPQKKKPVAEDIKQCSEPDMVKEKFQGCVAITSSKVSGNSCEQLKTMLHCIAKNIFPADGSDLLRMRCMRALKELIESQAHNLKTLFKYGSIDPKKCEERDSVCGDTYKPVDAVTCEDDDDCPDDHDCKSSYCCPAGRHYKEREGMCPEIRGTSPVCKESCQMDSDCDEDEQKCCDVGCGGRTCIDSEKHEKTRCEHDFENAMKQLNSGGVCGDGHTNANIPTCQNGRFHPQQGQESIDGHVYCVNEDGDKIKGTDAFTGNPDCTRVHEGKCEDLPQICQNADAANVISSCSHDSECDATQKCCHTQESDACVQKCVTAQNATEVVVDDCQARMCCPLTLCQDKKCPADESATCKPNTCGDCTAEFFTADNTKVDCLANVPLCRKTRLLSQQANSRDRKSESKKAQALLRGKWRRYNQDMDDKKDDDDDEDDECDYGCNDDDDDDDKKKWMKKFMQQNDDLPEDTRRGTKGHDQKDEIKKAVKNAIARKQFCHIFEKYHICKNNGSCAFAMDVEPNSYYQICKCPTGFYGLMCEKTGDMPLDTRCKRDQLFMTTYWEHIHSNTNSRESRVLAEVVNTFHVPDNILPDVTCAGDGSYEPIQTGRLLPLGKNDMKILYCVNTTTGERLTGAPIKWEAQGQDPDCTDLTNVDVLQRPRQCLAVASEACSDDTPCQFYFNQLDNMCVKGAPSSYGFLSLTDCYETCSLEQACLGSTSDSGEMDMDNCETSFFLSPYPCLNSTFTENNMQMSYCDYSHQYCEVSYNGPMQTGTCQDLPEHCVLEMEEGYGEDDEWMYYFNAATRLCEPFKYSGAGGNKNRFTHLHQCHTECAPQQYKYNDVACPTVESLMNGPMGMMRGDMCDSDFDCPNNDVCCSNGQARVCSHEVGSCFEGERCSLSGVCEGQKCKCPECDVEPSSPVCGSDGTTYDNKCLLQQHACRTMQNIVNASDGACEIPCGSQTCVPPKMCNLGSCACPNICTQQYDPICVRDVNSGVLRTFSTDCEMTVYACEHERRFEKLYDGECASGECMLPCTKDYHPVCVHNTTGSTSALVTMGNMCTVKNYMLCTDWELHIAYKGECEDRQCSLGISCPIYKSCVNNQCTCVDVCTREYMPVCAYPSNDPSSMETFSNICEMRKKGCNNDKMYYIQKKGMCHEPVPELECPDNTRMIPHSAIIACDVETDSYCREDQKCCPHGAGTICIPKKKLMKKQMEKDGVCPRPTYFNYNKHMCQAASCYHDGECAGTAKCCENTFCQRMTCIEPVGQPDDNVCSNSNMKPIPNVECDPNFSDNTCPGSSMCEEVTRGDETFGVCCLSKSGSGVTDEEILKSRLCHVFSLVGLECQNGGTCVGDIKGRHICDCPTGYYGPFCEMMIPPTSCSNEVNCFAAPCSMNKCPNHPGATCTDNYCGGCNALYTNGTHDVTSTCHDSPCWRLQKLAMKIEEKMLAVVDMEGILDQIKLYAPPEAQDVDLDELAEGIDGDTLWKHFVIFLRKMGVKHMPLHGEVFCTADGHFEPRQCSWSFEDGSQQCHCVHTDTGKAIMHGPMSEIRETLDCTYDPATGFQEFCLEVPDMELSCSDTETEKFYFNPETKTCEMYSDYGCNDNVQNSFSSMKTCKTSCGAKTPLRCQTAKCGYGNVCVVKDREIMCVQPDDGPGEFEPVCNAEGNFKPKQCHGYLCWCVHPLTGDVIVDSLAYMQHLECTDGDTVTPVRNGSLNNCADGTAPVLCKNNGDPCKNCQLSSTSRSGEEEGDKQVGQNGRCKSCGTCPGTAIQTCPSACDPESVCKYFPGAICQINKCTCDEDFYANNKKVNCSKVHSQCKREKFRTEMSQQGQGQSMGKTTQASDDHVQLKCNEEDGTYEAKCQGSVCHCLNAVTGAKVGRAYANTMLDDLDCSSTQKQTKARRIKIKFQISKTKRLADISEALKEQWKGVIKAFMERVSNVMVKLITFYDGSVLAAVTVEMNENSDTDLGSASNAIVSAINQGDLQTSEGIVSEALIQDIITEEEMVTVEPEPEPEDEKTTIIIIVVVVVVVAAIIAIAIGCYCYKKADKQKSKDMQFSNLEGKSNPMYNA